MAHYMGSWMERKWILQETWLYWQLFIGPFDSPGSRWHFFFTTLIIIHYSYTDVETKKVYVCVFVSIDSRNDMYGIKWQTGQLVTNSSGI